MARYVSCENADLTVRDLAGTAGILPGNAAGRLALLEKSSLVNDQDGIVICDMLKDIIADDIAQGIRIPTPATEDGLLTPRPRITCSLRTHPARLASLIAQQTIQKLTR